METTQLCLLLAIGLPLLGSPLLALAGRKFGARIGWLALAFPLTATGALVALALSGILPERSVVSWSWIPSLGIQLSFVVDGLSLFFGTIVAGMGCLVVFYAIHYLDDHYRHQGRFYCYLVLFMAAMLGTVFSNNLLLLFVFWELTGLASFLLIGFLHEEQDSRVGARQALLVTGLTGLALLAGVIMIYTVTGTYDFEQILLSKLPMAEHGAWLNAAMCLIALGAFGKSAQFPLHFWLPNAMAAPTPVSAYLHSATMVKLGVFLCARMFPLFSESELWATLWSVIPFATMLIAAVLALISHDLKAILAFSTVSQLGALIGYYGMGAAGGVGYDYLHILNHVFYKGCLFMVAGIVIHATGIRDIRQLGGLFRRMPLLGVAALLATASMAGLPGTTGFLSKEAMLQETFEGIGSQGDLGLYAAACVVLASIFKVAFSVRLFASLFLGKEPEAVGKHFHAPAFGMLLPPLLLAGCALFFGLAPGFLETAFHSLATQGLHRPAHLALWHGVTRELLASGAIVLLGFALFWLGARSGWKNVSIPNWFRFDRFFEAGLDRFSSFTKGLTRVTRSDRSFDYLPVVLSFVLVAVGASLLWPSAGGSALEWLQRVAVWPQPDSVRLFVAGLIVLFVLGVVFFERWTTQLISLSAAGFLTCFYFVLYRAPDLALTQILVEVVTLFMILILLGRFPRSMEDESSAPRESGARRGTHFLIALGMGALTTTLILVFTAMPATRRLGEHFLDQTIPLAQGSNAVNTVLVDFRGFDTLGEITVLVVALLGGLGLLMRPPSKGARSR